MSFLFISSFHLSGAETTGFPYVYFLPRNSTFLNQAADWTLLRCMNLFSPLAPTIHQI